MVAFEAFLDDGGIVEVDDDMPDAYRQAVFAFIEMHANSELMGGLTERDWIPKTPGLRHKMAVLAKTQDEIGHGHLLYMVAADMGIKHRREMLEDLFAGRSRFHNVFHYRAKTWGDQVAISFLVDAAALATQQAVFKNCSYGPYRRILKRIITEEGFHMRMGEERMLLIAEGTRSSEPCSRPRWTTGGGRPSNFSDPTHSPTTCFCDGTSSRSATRSCGPGGSRNSRRS
tara:strand:+ start:228 stop:914 length:687 start_codon:yes stop_codon:yes gene_type:complete